MESMINRDLLYLVIVVFFVIGWLLLSVPAIERELEKRIETGLTVIVIFLIVTFFVSVFTP
jgi:membrane protein DedA with SNARE-associated domain